MSEPVATGYRLMLPMTNPCPLTPPCALNNQIRSSPVGSINSVVKLPRSVRQTHAERENGKLEACRYKGARPIVGASFQLALQSRRQWPWRLRGSKARFRDGCGLGLGSSHRDRDRERERDRTRARKRKRTRIRTRTRTRTREGTLTRSDSRRIHEPRADRRH